MGAVTEIERFACNAGEATLGQFSVRLDYADQLWTAWSKSGGEARYEHVFGDVELTFFGPVVTIRIKDRLQDEQCENLLSCLVRPTPKGVIQYVPQWGVLTPDLTRLVQSIEKEVFEAIRCADQALRRSAKGVRVPHFSLEEERFSDHQSFPAIRWMLDGAQIEIFEKIAQELPEADREKLRQQGVLIPISYRFDQKQIFIKPDEFEKVKQYLNDGVDSQPFWHLYAIALENFSVRNSPDSAILILASAIETAIKFQLHQGNGDVAKFLIEEMQSPPLRKLLQCGIDNCGWQFPASFKAWLADLTEVRNRIAHRHEEVHIDRLEIGRWFAMGEAILGASIGLSVPEQVGLIIRPTGKNRADQFADDARGVILRTECFEFESEPKFHVLMDTGESYYFGPDLFEALPKADQRFPKPWQ